MNFCPLSGKPCNNHKIYHITEIVDGEVNGFHLCKDCAEGYMVNDQTSDVLQIQSKKEPQEEITTPADMIKHMLKLFGINLPTAQPQQKKIQRPPCPHCGCEFEQIVKTGRLGCPGCYKYFEKEVRRIMQYAHGATKHKGKTPKNLAALGKKPLQIKQRIKVLGSKMNRAVKKEDYELAGTLRDIIKELKQIEVEENELNEVLKKAILSEDYELASESSDKITELLKRYADIVVKLDR